MKRIFMTLNIILMTACGNNPQASSTSAVTKLNSTSQGPIRIELIRDTNISAGRGGYGEFFHVDALVRKLSYEKKVDAIWTVDGWRSTFVCSLAYEGDVNAEFERWGSDCSEWGTIALEYGSKIALSAQMAGGTYWDNNYGKNYSIIK